MAEVEIVKAWATATVCGTKIRVMSARMTQSVGNVATVTLTGIPEDFGDTAETGVNKLSSTSLSEYVGKLQKKIYVEARLDADCEVNFFTDATSRTFNGLLTNIGQTTSAGQVAFTYSISHAVAVLAAFNGTIYTNINYPAFLGAESGDLADALSGMTTLRQTLEFLLNGIKKKGWSLLQPSLLYESDSKRAYVERQHKINSDLVDRILSQMFWQEDVVPFEGFNLIGGDPRIRIFDIVWSALTGAESGLDMVFNQGFLTQAFGLTAKCIVDTSQIELFKLSAVQGAGSGLTLKTENLDFNGGAENAIPIRRVNIVIREYPAQGEVEEEAPPARDVVFSYPNDTVAAPTTLLLPVPRWVSVLAQQSRQRFDPGKPDPTIRSPRTDEEIMQAITIGLQAKRESLSTLDKAVLDWCKTMYLFHSLRSATSSLRTKFDPDADAGKCVSISAAGASSLFTAWIDSVVTEISINGRNGSATTTYGLTHIRAKGFALS